MKGEIPLYVVPRFIILTNTITVSVPENMKDPNRITFRINSRRFKSSFSYFDSTNLYKKWAPLAKNKHILE